MATQPGDGENYSDGRYRAQVFSSDPRVQDFVARCRARKLQPLVNKTDTLFEYGVGPALNLRFLKCARRAGFDPDTGVAELCSEHGIEFFPSLESVQGQTFSAVLAHHVLEHVDDPLATLRRLKPLLASGARLLLFVPFERGRTFFSGEPNLHLFSWTPQTLGNLVERAGLHVDSVSVGSYGYEQRLAPLGLRSTALYSAALSLARALRPCEEVRLIAR